MNPVVEASGLTKRFPVKRGLFRRTVAETTVVAEVDLRVERGEIVGLVGESGSGKSTIGRILIGFETPTAGLIRFGGTDLDPADREQTKSLRSRRQMIFQDPYASLNPRMTVGATVMEPLQVNGIGSREERRRRAGELLDLVSLPASFFDRYPHELSGGQRQRVCIARAIALSPEFIVADEALAALDVSIQAQIADLFLDLRDELGLAVLFITHDLAMAGYVCDRLVVLQRGSVVEEGAADRILAHPQERYTRDLVHAIPDIDV